MEHFVLGSRYYYSRLSDYEQMVYREIYDCWVSGSSVAKLELPGTDFVLLSGTTIHKIVSYIIEENPHLFHLETSQFNYHRLGQEVTISAANVYTSDEYKRIYNKLIERVNQITEKAKQYNTDYEKFRFLHDYLAENITYDYGAPDPKSQREAHTIVGALLNSACVCDGYARAFRLLCDQLHLSCIVAIGESTSKGSEGAHAWNIVKLNNRVYHVDVTWDSNFFADGFPVNDYYFLRGDAIFSKDHAWDSSLYPPIKADYPRGERKVASKWELEKYLCEKVKSEEKTILVHFKDDFPGSDSLKQLIKDIIRRNALAFSCVQSYRFDYYETMKIAQIHFYYK